jgi:hypothetical protein
MITEFKKLTVIGLALMALAAVTVSTQAQVPTYAAQTLWSTNGTTAVTAAAATTLNAVIDCRKQATFTLAITAQCDTSGGAISLMLLPSLDGITYGSQVAGSGFKTVGFTPTTAGVTMITNINTLGVGYWKATYLTNDTGAAVTNFSVKYAIKISAP